MSKLRGWIYAILFFLALLAGTMVLQIGWHAVIRDRLGFFLVGTMLVGVVAYGSVWGLNLLGRAAWQMATDEDNRKSNGLIGAFGLVLGISICVAMLWLSVKAFVNLVGASEDAGGTRGASAGSTPPARTPSPPPPKPSPAPRCLHHAKP